MKRKILNRDTLLEASRLLQAVTPTDGCFQADWYTYGYGKRIMNSQLEYINLIKFNLIAGTSKEGIGNLINHFGVEWPKAPDADPSFWKSGFGRTILKAWDEMIGKFVDLINSLVEPVK